MKPITLIYSFHARHTADAAGRIAKVIGEDSVIKVNVETIDEKDFLGYDHMILGVSTWFDGELPNYWDEFLPALEEADLSGKTMAFFGTADQMGYPQNFADAIGILADFMKSRGARIIGEWPSEDYRFISSRALVNGKFTGLVLDYTNQPELTDIRIGKWVDSIRPHFK
jgi:flavodoxin I